MGQLRYAFTGDDRELVATIDNTIEHFQRLDRVATKTGTTTESSSKRMRSGMEGAKQAATALGGQIGALGGRTEAAARAAAGFGEALGPIGAAVGAAVGVAAALAGAMYTVATASIEAQKRLIEAGQGALIPREARQSVEDYQDATAALGTSVDQLLVSLGQRLLPVLTELVSTTSKVVDMFGAGAQHAETFASGVRLLADVVSLGTLPLLREGYGLVQGLGQQMHDAAGDTEAWRRRLEEMGVSTKTGAGAWLLYASSLLSVEDSAKKAQSGLSDLAFDMAMAAAEADDAARKANAKNAAAILQKRREEAAKRAEEAAKKAAAAEAHFRAQAVAGIEAQVEAAAALDKMTAESFRATLDGEAAVRVAHLDRLQTIADLAAASQDQAAADAARVQEQVRFERELADVRAKAAEEKRKADLEAWQLDLDLAKQRLDTWTRESEAYQQQQDTIRNAAVGTFNAITDASKSLLDQQIENAKNGTAAEKNRALAAFAIDKALGIVQVAINTAVAITTALRQLGPIAGGIAAVGIGATGAAQAATIAAQKPPSFAAGGIVPADVLAVTTRSSVSDHGPVMARPGEGFVTQRGVDAAGGERGIEALNQGRQPWGPMVVQQVYGHRAFDAFVTDNLKRGGPLAKAIASSRKPGHTRRAA